jgi:hypothetical protein
LDARRPSNGSRDLLLLDKVARCDSSGRDTPSATDAGQSGPVSRVPPFFAFVAHEKKLA